MKKLFILLAAGTTILASCGGGQKPQSSETTTTTTTTEQTTTSSIELTVNAIGNTMDAMGYDTKEIKVKAGAKVKLTLTNKATDGAMIHNIVFVNAGTEKDVAMEGLTMQDKNYFNSGNPNVIAGSSLVKPGESTSIEFTAPAAGTYAYICTFPGHWMKMQGVLIVE